MRFYEDTKRSLLKAVTFRFFVIIADSIVIFTLTHRYDVTVGVVMFSNLTSTIIYFVHERLWNHIHFGKHHKVKK